MSFGVQGLDAASTTQASSTSTQSASLRPFANLDLTEDQRTKIRSILQNAKSQNLSKSDVQSQINGVLTPAQQAQMQTDITTAQQQQQAPPDVFANLNLTSTQQSQIQSILQNAQSQGTSASDVKSQIDAVLTSTQQTQFNSNLAALKSSGHSGHHHGGGGNASSSSTDSTDTDAWGVTDSTSDSTSSAATVNGQSVQDLQNQVLAGISIQLQQIQNELGLATSPTSSNSSDSPSS